MKSNNFHLITLLAIHDFGTIGSIGCLEFIGAGRGAVEMGGLVDVNSVIRLFSGAGALTTPELGRSPLFSSLVVPTIWTKSGQRKSMFFQKLKFFGNNAESGRALLVTPPPYVRTR